MSKSIYRKRKKCYNYVNLIRWEVQILLNVLIAENDMQKSVHLSNCINSPNVRCIGILNESTKVYQKIKELQPDVTIIDFGEDKRGKQILEEIEGENKSETSFHTGTKFN